ncbi:MAG: hypothetical protein ACRBK7_02085 [Acidimicrobiales bacterium]
MRTLVAAAVLLFGGPLVWVSPSAALTQVSAIPLGSQWSFSDDGSDQGTAWREIGFAAAGWGSGAGELGYGDGDEGTVVSYGPDRWQKHATTYFRHQLHVVDVAAVSAISVSLKYDDGAVVYVNGTEVYRVGMPTTFNYATYTGTTREGTRTFSVDPALLVEGANAVAVEVHQSTRTSSDISFDLSMIMTRTGTPPVNPPPVEPPPVNPPPANPPPVIPELTDNIPFGSVWAFLDDGTDQGSAWRSAGFTPAGWGSGAGELGYGDGDEATVVSYGPDRWQKYATTYFRREVNVADPADVNEVVMSLKYDDGAVVYVNGTEVRRVSMPATFDYSTYTGKAREGTVSFVVDPALLVDGANVIAVEVHQAGRTSSDISFDLAMTVNRDVVAPPPPPVNPPAPPSSTEHPAINISSIGVVPITGQHGVIGHNPGDSTNQEVKVWDMHQVGTHMYVGGEFQQVVLGDGGAVVNQAFLARFDVATGAFDPSFTPALDGTVLALEQSPGGHLLVAGEFTTIDGIADTAGLAAINPATGTVDTAFRSSLRRPWSSGRAIVRDIKVHGTDVYAVGQFSHTYDRATAQRVRVYKAVRLDANTGVLDATWLPQVSGSSVWGVAVDPDRGRVFLSGAFSSVNAQSGTNKMAVVDWTSGAVVPNALTQGGGWQTYDVEYVGDRVFTANNRENRVTVYDANTYNIVRGMDRSDGDFQFVERIGNLVLAGCHCWQDPDYPFVRALDATTGAPIDKVFNVSGNIEGIFTAASDTTGCLWIGGDVRNGGFGVGTVWARGFARFCP